MGSDFNGDGRDDVLWRHRQNDSYTDWLATPTGGFTNNSAAFFRVVPEDSTVVGTGDFNGDGRDDILWRNENGTVSDWLGNPIGGFDVNQASVVHAPTNWFVVGVSDFNDDGYDDILWRNTVGTIGNWLGTASGGFAYNQAAGLTPVASDWNVVGTGDFNGDGYGDILWRNDNGALGNWLGNADGGYMINDAGVIHVPTDWTVVGTGDFDGDGYDDILWRQAGGAIGDWLGNVDGGYTINQASVIQVSTDWRVVATGDYDGDGNDDILWRSGETLTNWLATDDGTFVGNDSAAHNMVDTEWFVQPNPNGAGWWDY